MDFDIKQIRVEDLLGSWKILSRYPLENINPVFKTSYHIQLSNGIFKTTNGVQTQGKWTFIKEQETIYHPQLKFFTQKTEIAHAMVTRLYSFYKNYSAYHKMTLYFSSGHELILEKEYSKP